MGIVSDGEDGSSGAAFVYRRDSAREIHRACWCAVRVGAHGLDVRLYEESHSSLVFLSYSDDFSVAAFRHRSYCLPRKSFSFPRSLASFLLMYRRRAGVSVRRGVLRFGPHGVELAAVGCSEDFKDTSAAAA